ncbi:hypothetical protein PTKIN_Ptkin01aG0260500 [Pterospermum kingtungense]
MSMEGGENGEHRISNLDDDLLHKILSFFDTKYAVQSCVLSKRWNFLRSAFISVSLIFCIKGSPDVDAGEATVDFTMGHLCNFITQVLFRRRPTNLIKAAQIYSFSSSEVLVSPWIPHDWTNLEISIPTRILVDEHKNLCVNALNLKYLELSFLDNDLFPHAGIYRCKLMIDAPKLTTFKDIGYTPIVCSKDNLPSLDDVYFDIYDAKHKEKQYALQLINPCKEFRYAKSLTLSSSIVEVDQWISKPRCIIMVGCGFNALSTPGPYRSSSSAAVLPMLLHEVSRASAHRRSTNDPTSKAKSGTHRYFQALNHSSLLAQGALHAQFQRPRSRSILEHAKWHP